MLVHPPGGLVGGDTLDMRLTLGPGAHALVTTPGATRFYRSDGPMAQQQVHARLQSGARLEWLPLEGIAYSGCQALNQAVFELEPSAELMAWDITALGLPSAGLAFEQGRFRQHIELPGVWLERGDIRADDHRLLNGPVGLAGHRCLGTLLFACGTALDESRRDQALALARQVLESSGAGVVAGATSPHPQVLVVRVLSAVVEPAMGVLKTVRARWRECLWQLEPTVPRLWHL